MIVTPFPTEFPNKGRYRVYSKDWSPFGYADFPQYNGQQPVAFPENASPIECFYGGYIHNSNDRLLSE